MGEDKNICKNCLAYLPYGTVPEGICCKTEEETKETSKCSDWHNKPYQRQKRFFYAVENDGLLVRVA